MIEGSKCKWGEKEYERKSRAWDMLPFFFLKILFIYLFDGERGSQREKEHKQGEWEREKQAHRGGAWRGARSRPEQTLNRCATQAPLLPFLNKVNSTPNVGLRTQEPEIKSRILSCWASQAPPKWHFLFLFFLRFYFFDFKDCEKEHKQGEGEADSLDLGCDLSTLRSWPESNADP